MFNIEPVDLSKMTIEELMKLNGQLYRVVVTDEDKLKEEVVKKTEENRLKNMSLEDLSKDDKYQDLFEDKSPKESPETKPKYAKYYSNIDKVVKKANQAPYVTMMSTMNGDIWVKPLSNGSMKIEFDDKNKAEVYLKKFKQKLHYSTNSVDSVGVMELYNLLGIVVPLDIKKSAEKYEWLTVSSLSELRWISSCVTKCVDNGCFGWTITKRAKRKQEKQ